ncbi:hypothetical protein SCUCBS95973_009689 [Sporothrix curviconia]|uniref:Uncharacterized protein n=1 Tax=Sporothrix curviconia TaxID=1260050 RepID=A0ABP0CX78_9PEZI
MADDNDPPKNPFVRWKQHVDAHIGMTLQGLLGIPNMVSKNLNIRQEPNSGSGSGSEPGSGPADGSQPPPSSSSSPPPPPPPPSSSQANARSIAGSGNGGSSSSSNTHSNYTPSLPTPTGPSDNDDGLDGVDAAQLLAWHKFVYYSPYSPLKLQQQQHLHLLPPPVPQDVPFGADPFAFTYADAFEDLLRASSGGPLLDLADRSYRNLHYQMRYGSTIEPPYAFFHRMHSQRLLDAYFPRSLTAAAAAVGSAEEKDGFADTASDDVVRAVTALAERDRDLWREQRAEEAYADKHDGGPYDDDTGEWDDGADEDEAEADGNDDDDEGGSPWIRRPGPVKPQSYGYGGTLFGELDRVFRVLGRIIDEDTGAAAERAANKNDQDTITPHSAMDKTEAEANAEDELYNAVRSAYSNAERSLGSLIKTFSGSFDSSSSSSSSSSISTTGSASSIRDTDGRQGDTIQTTEEHIDAFGNRHVKTVVQRLDADGNEVARETRYTIRSQSAQEAAALKDAYDDDSSGNDEEGRGEKNADALPKPASSNNNDNNDNNDSRGSGWFWK